MSARTMVLGLLAATAVLATTSATAGPWLPAPGEHYNEFDGDFASTQVYFDADGTKRFLPLRAVHEERGILSQNEFGWKKWASVAIGIPVVSRTIHFPDFRFQGTQTGIADLSFGLRAKLKSGPTALALEAQWVGPAGYDRDAFPALGPGQQNVAGLLHFGAPIATKGFIQLASGYQYRFDKPADRIVGSGAVAFWVSQSVLVSGRFHGWQTVSADTVLNESRALIVGPEVRYRLDDQMDIFAGSWHTAKGKNVDHFNRYYVGVAIKRTGLNRLQGYLGGKRRP